MPSRRPWCDAQGGFSMLPYPMPKQLQKPPTDALNAFADALEKAGIEVRDVEVSLPIDDWQHLARTLDNEAKNGAPAPSGDIGQVTISGVRYLVRFAAKR